MTIKKYAIMVKKLFWLTFNLFLVVSVNAQDFQTLTYFSNDTISLELDLFVPQTAEEVPLVLFVHGGGFATGNKFSGHKLAKYLAKNNIACASIDYTLYMSDKSFSCDGITSEKVKAMQIAASETWLATQFLINKSKEYKINIDQIFLAGSSAGAETVLHAAFWDREKMQYYAEDLAPEFKYAGVISGAGAIMDLNLITLGNKLPIMMFHGDADVLVPYKTAAHHYCPPDATGWLMFFGSHSIAKHIEELAGTVYLATFKGGSHYYADAFFYQNHDPITNFISKVLKGEKYIQYDEFLGLK